MDLVILLCIYSRSSSRHVPAAFYLLDIGFECHSTLQAHDCYPACSLVPAIGFQSWIYYRVLYSRITFSMTGPKYPKVVGELGERL